jgi:acyl carrier protein
MNGYCRILVHRLVAAQLRLDAHRVTDDDRFEDLGLQPMDLVLIVLRLEHLDRGQGDFPLAALEHARTVGDLVLLVDVWMQRDTIPAAAVDAAKRDSAA